MGCPGVSGTKMQTGRLASGKRFLGRRREACVCSLEKVGVRAREDFVVQGIKVYWFHVMIGVPVVCRKTLDTVCRQSLSLWDSDTDVDAGYTAMVIDDDICRS